MTNLLVFFSLLVCICYFLKYLYAKRKYYLLSWKLPGPIAFPIIGNALAFFCKNEDIFEKAVTITSLYSSPMRFWLGPKFLIIFSDPDQASKILSSSNFSTKDKVYKYMKIVNGEGLISGSGLKWRRDRKLMAPIFAKKNVEEYFSVVSHHANILLDKLQNVGNDSFNIETYLHRCCADFVNESIIGLKTDAQNGEMDNFLHAVDRMYALIHARITKVWLQIEWFFKTTQYYKQQENDKTEIHNFLRQVIRLNEKKRLSNDQLVGTFLDKILDIKEKIPVFATEDNIVHHLCTLYTASEDTVTTIASFTFLLLGMYPEIQEKIQMEINNVVGDQHLELAHLSKLEYLEMCLKDVLRLFPIAPFIIRTTTNDFSIDQITIPRSCSVVISIHNIHRNPIYWERPNEFYPEHFLPKFVKSRHPYAYIPFSAGPRGCLGKPYSYMALKILITLVVRKYQISAEGKLENLKLKTDISVRTKDRKYPVRMVVR